MTDKKFLLDREQATSAIRQYVEKGVKFVGSKIIGPDDELFTFAADDGEKFYLFVRDYMSHDLDYEADFVKENAGVEVGEFLRVKNSHNYMALLGGLGCLAFTAK